ncbi:MAG: hypothetical protein CVU97_06300 [Firmicutes bacterium HGW-Firmicutes-21]|nr:MAG: hypothetical protein CVU97_06300 [Firmicutes bacterium HGW-Firmicutes-21]
MNSLFNLLKKNKHILLLFYWPVNLVWYQLMRIYGDRMPRFYLVSSPIDDYIPFCEWFVLPYVTWYFYIIAVLIYTLVKGKREFLKASGMIMGCMFLSMLITTIFPSGISESIRPDFTALGRDNILIDIVKYLYSIDSPPRVVMPSMHAGVAAALFIVVMKAESLKGKTWIKAGSFLLSFSICLSIVLIKQHSYLDGIAGVALAILLYFIVYKIIFRIKKVRDDR